MKRCSTLLIEKCTLKPQWCYHVTQSEWPSSKTLQIKNAGEGVEKNRIFLHCWLECKLVQPLWKTAYGFLKKLKIELPYDPAIQLLGIHLEKTSIWKDACTRMFIAALFTLAKIRKHSKCPSTHDWLKMWCIWKILGHYYFPGKESACNAGDPGSVPELGRSPGEGNGYPLQYSCLENSMERGAWQAIVHGVAKS